MSFLYMTLLLLPTDQHKLCVELVQPHQTDILLPAQLGNSAAGPVHQPMQGGLPSVDEEVLLPWEIIARINCEYSSGDRARLGQNSEGIKKFNIQRLAESLIEAFS